MHVKNSSRHGNKIFDQYERVESILIEIYSQSEGLLKDDHVQFRTLPLYPFWSYAHVYFR